MSFFRYIVASILFHWRVNLAVGLGVATATAVLTGALLVGDSVRGSLRDLTIQRLGRIDHVLATQRFFRQELADEVERYDEFSKSFEAARPAMLLSASLRSRTNQQLAGGVNVLGCAADGWDLGPGGPAKPPTGNQIVLNDRLASESELNVAVGDRVLLQIGVKSDVPADSPLGDKHDSVRRREFVVSDIIPSEGFGRFGLHPNQQLPKNAFVSLRSMQTMLDADGKANAILVLGRSIETPSDAQSSKLLNEVLRPELVDYGLNLEQGNWDRNDSGSASYYQLTTDRMLLKPPVVAAAERAWSDERTQRVLTYLANWIATDERKIPYSTITAVDSTASLGPLLDENGKPIHLGQRDVALNDWAAAAEDLDARSGDEVTMTHFAPETTHGQAEEFDVSLRVKAIVPLRGADGRSTAASDRALTPQLEGVTDQDSLDEWDPPFPYDSDRNRRRDEDYWDVYRTTPKAFVAYDTGQRLWGSRFGDTTSIRVLPTKSNSIRQLAEQLESAIEPAEMGFIFMPVKRQGLQAASGTTPFDLLFLGFSMFLIAAALMLVSLLFRLGVEQRASEIGLVSAVGFARRRAAVALSAEGLLVATSGAAIGVFGGIGYAWLMLAGLRTWWIAAISTPFMHLHISPTSLVVGFIVGVFVSWLTIVVALRRLRRIAVRQLMSGQAESTAGASEHGSRFSKYIAPFFLIVAAALIPVAMQLDGEAQAGAFFGAGGLMLASALLWLNRAMQAGGRISQNQPRGIRRFGIGWLATRNAARHATRSTLTIGLVAAASFLIIAISSFQLDGTDAGAGGFDLIATSAAPIYYDLASGDGRFELGIDSDTDAMLAESKLAAMRVQAGNDASCLNLYRPRQPRVVGVPAAMSGTFQWAAVKDESDDPWALLDEPLGADADKRAIIPVIIDMNTAMYSLHLWKGIGQQLTIEDEHGGRVTLQLVAMLKNSIFQGDILVGESNFLKVFPSAAGYRYFLIQAPEGEAEALQVALEDRLGDYGFDVSTTRQRLENFFAVQNTYLETFQSLGGLGLLLGTIGLATVQLRNVVARRGELALLRATGFRRRRLAWLVLLENVYLLVAGLAIGVLASLVTVLPHYLLGGAHVPWRWLLGTLVLVLVVGLLVGLAAVRAALRAPVIAAIRGE